MYVLLYSLNRCERIQPTCSAQLSYAYHESLVPWWVACENCECVSAHHERLLSLDICHRFTLYFRVPLPCLLPSCQLPLYSAPLEDFSVPNPCNTGRGRKKCSSTSCVTGRVPADDSVESEEDIDTSHRTKSCTIPHACSASSCGDRRQPPFSGWHTSIKSIVPILAIIGAQIGACSTF